MSLDAFTSKKRGKSKENKKLPRRVRFVESQVHEV
jgi:hypothetical protein